MGEALAGMGQTLLHDPQLAVSVAVIAQMLVVVQNDVPVGHELTHIPDEQWVPSPQAVPHPPQLALVLSGASHPFAGLLSQSPYPPLQAATVHAPCAQPAVAFARLHAIPHAPHDVTVVAVFVSQPSEVIMLQSAYPVLQAPMAQDPAVQTAVALASVQAFPHAPQLCGSVAVIASQPSEAIPLQSA